jgi:hypothetical protein
MHRLSLLLCLAACGRVGFEPGAGDAGPPAEAPPRWTSGARLRAVIVEGTDGAAPMLDHWFDAQLGVACEFDRATDGEWHCLPTASGAASWSDAACTQPILEVGPPATSCGPQPYARVWDRGPAIYEVGAPWTGEVYRVNGGDPCFHFTSSLTDVQHFARGAEVPPSTFVRADEVVSPYHRLSYVSLVAEDGARERRAELYDTVLATRCSLVEVDLRRWACVPDGAVYGERVWSDGACSQPLLRTIEPASVISVSTATACTSSTRYFTPGTEVGGAFYRRDASGVCAIGTLSAGEHLYAIGDELPIDGYAGLDETVDDPAASTSALVAVAPDGMRVELPWRRDNVRGVRCTPIPQSPSEQLVCAPMWLAGPEVFTEATCADAIRVRPSCREDVVALWFPTAPAVFTCDGPAMSIQPFDGPPLPGPLWERIDGACVPLDPSVTAYPLAESMADISTLRPLRTRQE